jgi:acetyl esterase/lipase
MRALWVVGLVVVIGCKQTAPVPVASAPRVAKSPAAPAAPDERDLLWALAPEGATLGLVVSPHGVAMLERGAVAVQELLGSSPDFASIHGELMRGLLRVLGSMNPTLTGFGMIHDQGFAVFVVDDDQLALVLPVGDRDRFLAAMHGSKGADGDVVGSWVCKTLNGRYVCVQRRGVLGKLGRGGLDAMRRIAGARGDIEVAGRGFLEPLSQSIIAAAELQRGAVIVRGTLGGVARPVVDALGVPGRPRDDAAAAAGFGVADLSPMRTMVPPVAVAPGVTLVDLLRSFAGPITYVTGAGTSDPGIRIPLRDAAPARAFVEHCAELRPLAWIGATVHDGACRVPISGTSIAFEGWIDGMELRIANRAAAKASSIAPSPLARELAQGQWSGAVFGRGSYLDLRQARSQLPPLPPLLEGLLRVWPLLSELGVGIRKDGDSVHFLFGARTVWSNPDDVLHQLLAISYDDMLSGKAVQIGESIATAAPSSPFAQDFHAGTAGFVGLGAAIGWIAGSAVPAWTDHVKRTRYTPAEVHLGDVAIDAPGGKPTPEFPLVAARAALKTTIFMAADPTPAPDPPRDLLVKTHYRRGGDDLVAYETPPRPGARRPAIIWITGGFDWGIDATLWKPAPRNNDQTVTALRRSEIVVMFPALRGFNGNRGKPECFLGEIDDILAAAEHLAKRPDVDPARIYLGGHSTGGTMVLLAAASTDRFRAIFAFGPVSDPRRYGDSGCLPEGKPVAEYRARAPVHWVGSIVTPTLVIEGEKSGNVEEFPVLQEHASRAVTFVAVPGSDHFTVLAPATEALARAILADTGPKVSIKLDVAAIARGVEK